MDPAMHGDALLAVAHPGHELAVHGWLESVRPTVVTFTDGSGSDGVSRLDSTRQVLAGAGAREGSIFGAYSEREVYAALIGGRTDLFVEMCSRLSDLLVTEEPSYVAGEASEGFNPTHDVWRCVLDAAVASANRRRRRPLRSYQFLLFGRQSDLPVERRGDAIWLELDEAAAERKLAVARAYPELQAEVTAVLSGSAQGLLGRFPELAERVRPIAERMGPEAIRVECLFTADAGEDPDSGAQPFYEAYGERLAALGRFEHVIRNRHLQAVRAAVQSWAAA